MQALIDVVTDLEETPARVVELLLLRETPVRVVQQLESFLDGTHPLLTLCTHTSNNGEDAGWMCQMW